MKQREETKMEVNKKKEALKAKKIAEMKFSRDGDLVGAKEFALMAKNQDPSLDGIDRFIDTLDVHISASKRINGEVNWYDLLGVLPTADEDIIVRGYERLALSVHPKRNKSVGAAEAYRLVTEAFTVIGNTSKRLAYDQRIKIQPGSDPRIPNGFHDFKGLMSTSSQAKNQAAGSSSSKKCETFWTICRSCSLQYEYLTKYRLAKLLCPNCREPFKAVEVSGPSMNTNSIGNSQKQRLSRVNESVLPAKHIASQGQSSIFSPINLSQIKPSGGENYTIAQLRRAMEDVKKQTGQIDGKARNHAIFESRRRESSEDAQIQEKKPSVDIEKLGVSGIRRHHCLVQFKQPLNLRAAMIGMAKKAIEQSCKEYDSINQNNITTIDGESSLLDCTKDLAVANESSPLTMSVPDPDFYNFDKDRVEAAFKENQVWAAFDDTDGMPRFYAMIHKVFSLKPFKLSISWLNSKNNDELGPMDWIGSGFYKTSGNFRIGKREKNFTINSFSHKVKWTKGAKGVVRIYPKRGDVWAVYRNWSPDWNSSTPDEVIRKYDMVEVLEDFNEEKGVRISPLVKVAGFKTVFRRHPKSSMITTHGTEEMFRLSHQVASQLLIGQEIDKKLNDCIELDPAGMPPELLQVLTEKEVEEMENWVARKMEDLFKKKERPKKDMPMEAHIESGEKSVAEEKMYKVAEGESAEKEKLNTEETGVQVYKRRRLENN